MLIDPLTEEADARIACSKSWYALDPMGSRADPESNLLGILPLVLDIN